MLGRYTRGHPSPPGCFWGTGADLDNCAGCAVDVHVVKEDTTNPLQQLIGEMAKLAPIRLFCTGVTEDSCPRG